MVTTNSANKIIDEVDKQILELLQEDAKITINQIKVKIGVFKSKCYKTIRACETRDRGNGKNQVCLCSYW